MKPFALLFLILPFLALTAYAADGSSTVTVDDYYRFYVSTDDSTAGTFIGQSNQFGIPFTSDWATPESWNFNLTPGVVNYLHVEAVNGGGPSAFLGEFHLNNASFRFANGTDHLLTDTSSWKVYLDGWKTTEASLHDYGANGVSPWNTISAIDPNAHWIWSDTTDPSVFFSTKIQPLASFQVTPEPTSLLLFLIGVPLFFFAHRLRHSRA